MYRLQQANSIGDKRFRPVINDVSNELQEEKKSSIRRKKYFFIHTFVFVDKHPKNIVHYLPIIVVLFWPNV